MQIFLPVGVAVYRIIDTLYDRPPESSASATASSSAPFSPAGLEPATPAPPPVHPPTVPLLPGHGGPTEEQCRQGGLIGGPITMAGPHAHDIHVAGGKARMELPDASAHQSAAGKKGGTPITAKQLPGGPCPCTHQNHVGGKCVMPVDW
jgi:hypothetical protein